VFPAVPFEFDVNGRRQTESHVDGGITAQLFMPPGVFAAAGVAADPQAQPMPGGPNCYAIVSGRLYPETGPVRPRIVPVLSATTSALVYSQIRAELASMYWQSRLSGMRFHMIALRQNSGITVDTSVSFDKDVMAQLYQEGRSDGESGPRWSYLPPALE
jgi:hypothetical protein